MFQQEDLEESIDSSERDDEILEASEFIDVPLDTPPPVRKVEFESELQEKIETVQIEKKKPNVFKRIFGKLGAYIDLWEAKEDLSEITKRFERLRNSLNFKVLSEFDKQILSEKYLELLTKTNDKIKECERVYNKYMFKTI